MEATNQRSKPFITILIALLSLGIIGVGGAIMTGKGQPAAPSVDTQKSTEIPAPKSADQTPSSSPKVSAPAPAAPSNPMPVVAAPASSGNPTDADTGVPSSRNIAPSDATATCGDGTYGSGHSQQTCAQHGGVAKWIN